MPENVAFSDSVHILPEDKVETWLGKIEKMMVISLRDMTKLCLDDYLLMPKYPVKRDEWLFANYPAQSILVIELTYWTQYCNEAILKIQNNANKRAIKDFYEYCQRLMDSMVIIVRGELNLLQRTLMGALMVLDVHARDVVGGLD